MASIPPDTYEELKADAERMIKTSFFQPSLQGFLMRIDNADLTKEQTNALLEIISPWSNQLKEE